MEEGELVVEFDGREITYGFGELDELVLAYATTIHKSAGGPSGSAGARGAAARRRFRSAAFGRPGAGSRRHHRVVRLTEVFRQAAESRIIVNAHRINHGLMPDLAPVEAGDFYFVDAADAEEGIRKLLVIVQDRIPKRFGA